MTDIEIAQAAKAEPITKIAERAGIPEDISELYGSTKPRSRRSFSVRSKERSRGSSCLLPR